MAGGTIAACTVVSRSHLARAAALADSLAAHHPGLRLQALVTDGDRSAVPPIPGALLVRRPRDLALDRTEYHRMAAIYTPFELACALKPHIMRTLHAEGADAVLYLDGDMLVLGPVDDVFAAAAEHGLALTPHLRSPADATPATLRLEDSVLGAGWINGGLVATGRGGGDFLDWWSARLARGCRTIRPGGTVDQAPLALAPGLFDHVLLRDPGINTAWWTLAGERREPDPEVLTVGDRPVRVLHLSGYDPAAPHRFSAYDDAVAAASLAGNPPLRAHCDRYAAAIAAAGDADLRRLPYGFGHLSSGTRFDARMRALFDEALAAHEGAGAPAPPDPFGDDGGAAFISWLREPVGPLAPAAPVSRYLRHLWMHTPALRAEHPDLDADAPAFLGHCEAAARELDIAHDLLPGGAAAPAPRIGRGTLLVRADAAPDDDVGLAAALLDALKLAGARVTPLQASADGRADLRSAPVADGAILAVDAAMLGAADAALGSRLRLALPRAGLALWHGADPPHGLIAAAADLEDVWAPSRWAADTLAASGLAGAWVMPLPVVAPRPGGARERHGLGEAFVVHAVAGGDGAGAHDRPEVAIAAYLRAFGPDDGASLVLRLAAVTDHRERERLLHLTDWRADVAVLDDVTSHDADALLAESDCLVATDPATPTGYTVARAMAAGTLVIAPGTSGDASHLEADHGIALGPGDDDAHVRAIAGHLRAMRARPGDRAAHRAAMAAHLAAHEPARVGAALVARLAAVRDRA